MVSGLVWIGRLVRRGAVALALGPCAVVLPAGAVPSGCGGAACVNIQGLAGDTFDLGTWNGAANQLRVALRHCVFSNRPASGTKTYDATVTGVGTPGSAFVLAGPGGNLPYQVEINDTSGYAPVTANVAANFLSISEAQFDSCTNSATNNGGQQLRVTVLETDMETFETGTYSGTLRIDVATPVGGATDFEVSGTISVEIPPLVRLNGLKNGFNFGNWNPNTQTEVVNFDDDVCVWSNHPSDGYTVTLTSDTGALEMSDGANSLPYEVWWAETAGVSTVAGADAQLSYNTPEVFTATATTTACTGGGTASMVAAIGEAALSAAVAGAYTTTLLVTIGFAP